MRRSAVRRQLGVVTPPQLSARPIARRLSGAHTRRLTRAEVVASSSFTMPATAAFTIDALHFSHDENKGAFGTLTTVIDKTPAGLGAVTAGGPDAGSVVYSLPESEATNPEVSGWEINASTGQLAITYDQLVRDVCSGPTRTFKVRGTIGGTWRESTVTITLDASAEPIQIPGISYAVGAGVIRPVSKTIAVDGIPSGWTTYNPGNGWQLCLVPTVDGAQLVDYDLRGTNYSVYTSGAYTKNDVLIENCIFDHAWISQPTISHYPIVALQGLNCTVRYTTIDCNGREYPWRTDALNFNSVGGLVEYCRFLRAPNDVINSGAGTFRYNYGSCVNTNNRQDDGVTVTKVPSIQTGTANPANLGANGTIIINGTTVNLTTGQTPAQVRDAINAAAITDVTASIVTSPANALRITFNTSFDALGDEISPLTLAGTLLTHFGLTAGTYTAASLNNHGSTWGHGDGNQSFNILGLAHFYENWFDCRWPGRDPITNVVLTGRTAAMFFEGRWSTTSAANLIAEDNWCIGATYHLHASGGSTPRTGTISLSAASATVTGTGTTFLSDFGLSGAGAPSTSNANDRFWLYAGVGAGMEFTVTNVASNNSLTLSAVAGITDASAKMWKGARTTGLTIYRRNRFMGLRHEGEFYSPPRWASSWEQNVYGKAGDYYATGVKSKGDAYGPTINPTPVPPTFTIADIGQDWVRFQWTVQNDTRTYFRHRTTSGPGSWTAWLLVDNTTKLYQPVGGDALAASTGYDFQSYTENWNTSLSAYSAFTGITGFCTRDGSSAKLLADSATSSIVAGTTTSAGSLDAITTAFASASNTAGRTLSTYEQDMLDDFVNTLQAGAADAGNRDILGRMDVLSLLALGSIAGKINLLNPGTFDAVIVGSPVWTGTAPAGVRPNTNTTSNTANFLYWAGYKGYYDAGNKAKQNDMSMGVFVSQAGNQSNYRDMGTARASFTLFQFNYDPQGRINATADATYTDGLGVDGNFSGSETLRRGLHVVSRGNSTQATYSLLRPDGSAEISYTATQTSSAATNSIYAIGGRNDDTTGANPTVMGLSTTNRQGLAFCGAELTAGERDVLRDALMTLLTNLSLY